MAGRTPGGAVAELVASLQRALSCVTPAVLISSGRPSEGRTQYVTFGGEGLARLRGPQGLSLVVRRSYTVEQPDAARRWIVRTHGYEYRMLNDQGRDVLAYHWHAHGRSSVTWPHVHVHGRAVQLDLRRAHLPTGYVSLRAVLRLAIDDLGVQPLRADWRTILDEAERADDGR